MEETLGTWTFPLVTLWDTTNISEGSTQENQIKLPITSALFTPFTVEWGDGTSDNILSYNDIKLTHTYDSAGLYEVVITGDSLGFSFAGGGDRLKILEISDWGGLQLMINGFQGCEHIDLTKTTGSPKNLRNLRSVFRGCSNISYINDLDKWDVSQVTNMTRMFEGTRLNQDISKWNFNINVILEDIMINRTSDSYDPSYYDALLQKLSQQLVGKGRSQENRKLGMGSINYTSAGETARNILVSDGWEITDGGMI